METLSFKKWHPLEMLWLVFAPLLVLFTGLCSCDSAASVASAVIGTLFVILCVRGKWYCFLFGVIHSILYGYFSWKHGFYSESILKIFYYVPMHLLGAYVWYKFTSRRTHEVIHRNFYGDDKIIPHVIVVLGTLILGTILNKIGGSHPYMDAFTTFASIYATYLMVKRHGEMWFMFIVINFVSAIMWLLECEHCQDHLTIVVMWIIWTINAIYGLIVWKKY